MPIFVCDECNTMENTALGHYWARSIIDFKDESKNGKALCSACVPSEYSDGSISSKNTGEWHDRFERKQWDGKRSVINR